MMVMTKHFISGSCYLFCATAVLESAVSIEYKTSPVKLSAQHSLECVKNMTVDAKRDGCKGGRFVM
jgi:C1A family cysteine protease